MDLSVFRDNWILVAFLAPMLWALVNIIDVYFVDGIYQDEWDGLVISGLFQLAPWVVIIPFVNWDFSRLIVIHDGSFTIDRSLPLAFLGGFFLMCAYYFYFKALFYRNDVALFQVLGNLTVVVVPILAFIIYREVLPLYQYAGMSVTLAGATILSLNKKLKVSHGEKFFWTVVMGVIFFSLSLVVEEQAYSSLREQGYGNQGFLIGLFFFSLGAAFSGGMFAFIKKRNPLILTKKYLGVFVFAEGFNFFGNLASQRAIDIAPSVSYVATIGTFIPVFVLLFSFVILGYSLIRSTEKHTAKRIYTEQVQGVGIKVIATIIMAVGVYMIS